jgi:hypothetical protein
MATLQQEIAEKFLVKLSESKDVDAETIARLRRLFAERKRVKPDDLVSIFSLPPGGDLE